MSTQRPTEGNDLRQRTFWLIRLRWLAAAAVALGTFVCARIFHMPVQETLLYTISALLFLYNAAILSSFEAFW